MATSRVVDKEPFCEDSLCPKGFKGTEVKIQQILFWSCFCFFFFPTNNSARPGSYRGESAFCMAVKTWDSKRFISIAASGNGHKILITSSPLIPLSNDLMGGIEIQNHWRLKYFLGSKTRCMFLVERHPNEWDPLANGSKCCFAVTWFNSAMMRQLNLDKKLHNNKVWCWF